LARAVGSSFLCRQRHSPASAAGLLLRVRAVTVYASQKKLEEMTLGGANASLDTNNSEKVSAKRLLRGVQGTPSRPLADNPEYRQLVAEIHEHIRARRYAEALRVFDGVSDPDAPLYSVALNACAKGLLWEDASRIWEKLAPEKRCVVSYTTMLDLCKRLRKVYRAEGLFSEMQAAGIEPNSITYTTMIGVYSAAGDPDKALEVFEIARTAPSADTGIVNKQMMYLAAMSATSRVGDYGRTRELFLKLSEDGIPPTNVHFNALMTACAGVGELATAQAIFDMMPQYGLRPRLEDYIILVSCARFDLKRCLELVAEMEKAGFQLTDRVHTQLLEAYVIAGDGPGAQALLARAGNLDEKSRKSQRLVAQARELIARSS